MEKFELKNVESVPKWKRFGLLKEELRYHVLEKSEPGYQARYFYVPLQELQRVAVQLENKYNLTSVFTEETREIAGEAHVFAVRSLYDIETGEFITKTEINISNLKIMKDAFGLGKDILTITQPRDAISTIFYDYIEAQGIGSISTYLQRYTYNQLYDFQETKEDAIEVRGRIKDQPKEEGSKKTKKETPTPKETRKEDKGREIKQQIKNEFSREDIIEVLNGRKLMTMTQEEALSFYEEIKTKKGDK